MNNLLNNKNKLLENMIVKDNQNKLRNINNKDANNELLYKDMRYHEMTNPDSPELHNELKNNKSQSSLHTNIKENYKINQKYTKAIEKIEPENKVYLNLKDNNINAARINFIKTRKDSTFHMMKFKSNKDFIYKSSKFDSNEFKACSKEDLGNDDVIYDKNKKREFYEFKQVNNNSNSTKWTDIFPNHTQDLRTDETIVGESVYYVKNRIEVLKTNQLKKF